MKLHLQISAGEFFELLRPLALVVSALLSAWVLASARRRFRFAAAIAWALVAFLFPFIVIPIYLIARSWSRRAAPLDHPVTETPAQAKSGIKARIRFLLPASYGVILLSFIGVYFYRDYHTVDAYLARAEQAKVMNNRAKAMREYRAALALEDNPHTHKLLGMELAAASDWQGALNEFRAAAANGEPDPALSFRMAQAFEMNGQGSEAIREYKIFLASAPCNQSLPLEWCSVAKQNIVSMQASHASR